MSRLIPEFTAAFSRDLKKLDKKHVDTSPLEEVIELILTNDSESLEALRNRHNMHTLKGVYAGSFECHIANCGDWLLIWTTSKTMAVLERTGSHDELFR